MKIPDRRRAELNEFRWWSRWATPRRRGDGYLLYSESLREPFFNRAGSLTCRGVSVTAAWAEARFSRLGMSSTLVAFESCRSVEELVASGYRQVDSMAVLVSKGPVEGDGADVVATTSPVRWTAAYLGSFYGSEGLAAVVNPIVASLLEDRTVSLLESRAEGETVGVLALFRTPGLIGVYCVGTLPGHRRRGVATGLLARARRMAELERRTMVLQTLASDGALKFYLGNGFEVMYNKVVLERKLK